jgi:thymidylate synthase ThyX
MPENKKISKIKLPMKLKFNKPVKTKFLTENEAIKVTMINYPPKNYKEICYRMIMSTWADKPIDISKIKQEDINRTFKELISFKILPNSMEMLNFTFLIEGLTHIEISHMLRHRNFSAVHALCSGDRDLRNDNIVIPESIKNSEFKEKYEKLSQQCKELYAKMVDSKNISLMDARYILTRNHLYYYYFTMNLKDALAFINQRKCTQIQPYTDNLIAKKIYENIISVIPEVADVISLKCDERCHYVKTANTGKATNLYLPDKTHDCFDWNSDNFIYKKKRYELGIPKTIQDE